eukprot:GFUD01105654.1.p1 GENE.GFUD01105654.1~~GFUD01105654.1.p1  ORF type:complete len:275 (+),score=82.62 GFUD01105654.1:111-935(+)
MNSNNNDQSYAGRCASFGSYANSFLLKHQDKAAVEKMVEEQVELLRGNKELYNMIDNNMMNGDLDPFFIREHCAIYSWRETFFCKHFPNDAWFTVDFLNDTFPFDPENGFYRFITIPYQITRYFDRVMAFASAKVDPELSWLKRQIYFENNEQLSDEAECKYKWEELATDFTEDGDELEKLTHCEDINIGFSEVAHLIVEVHQTGPKKLEEISLKAVMHHYMPWDFLPLDDVPRVIQKKAIHGMYDVEDDTPDNISDEGKEMFEKMRKVFSNTL